VAQGTSDELRGTAPLRFVLRLTGDAGWVRGVPGVTVLDVDGGTVLLEPDTEERAQQLLAEAVTRGGVREFSKVRPSLSEIYREVARV
jgi:ABC-2 type transport system ATP-binding protein